VKRLPLGALTVLLSLSGCASPPPVQEPFCASGNRLADDQFEGGNLGRCVVSEDGVFELTNYPEDAPPINVSPWYAFRLSGTPGDEVSVVIRFEDGFARYWPKTSPDGHTWERLPESRVTRSEDGIRMSLRLELEGPRLWVAGQELLVSPWYDQWISELGASAPVTTRLLGSSVEGRPIYLAETADRPEFILLLGRQHPPEVTGALAMRPFVTTVLADTELARRFRERYQVLIIPMLNPDGVAAGHWRHNVDGVDLNRDWGPFTQPETQLVRKWLDTAEDKGRKPRLMLDFHSTQKNVFYTQRDIDPTDPEGFTARWLTAVSEHIPDYTFVREAAETSEQANSKNYFYRRYGIPAITYETGDETPRDEIAAAAVVFAEEMMRILLSYPPAAKP